MIFVIMGMEIHPFDRLARAVDTLAESGALGEDFLVQLGSCTYEPRRARFQRYLSFGEVCEAIRASSAVVTHAGAGSTLVCIQEGKHPVMVPRRARFGEHVDEHQVPFARKLSDAGLATAVDDLDDLAHAIAHARTLAAPHRPVVGRATELTGWLERFWQERVVGDPGDALPGDGSAPRRTGSA